MDVAQLTDGTAAGRTHPDWLETAAEGSTCSPCSLPSQLAGNKCYPRYKPSSRPRNRLPRDKRGGPPVTLRHPQSSLRDLEGGFPPETARGSLPRPSTQEKVRPGPVRCAEGFRNSGPSLHNTFISLSSLLPLEPAMAPHCRQVQPPYQEARLHPLSARGTAEPTLDPEKPLHWPPHTFQDSRTPGPQDPSIRESLLQVWLSKPSPQPPKPPPPQESPGRPTQPTPTSLCSGSPRPWCLQ